MSRLKQLLKTIRPFYEQNDPGHDLSHAVRVAKLAQKIADEEGGDVQVILPAALCHDLRRWEAASHSKENAKFIANILKGVGYPAAEIEPVIQAIQCHSSNAPKPPSTLEEKILFDADKLEGLGAVGIGRCFAVSGALNQSILDAGMDTSTAQHMLTGLMSRYYDRLHTETARRIGKARHDFLLAFVGQLQIELSVVADTDLFCKDH
jgi:uncharacterized protein